MGFSTVEGRDVGDVRLFTMSTCAWCDKMKELISEYGIKYHYIDLDTAEDAERDETIEYLNSIYPKWGFPSLLFDERVLICGYQEEEIRQTLGLPPAEEKKQESAEVPVSEELERTFGRLLRFSQKKGCSLNPDKAITTRLISGLLENQKRYGYWACPCRLAAGKREEDRDIICPCDYWEQDVAEFGACYCGLFVSDKVVSGELELSTVPERRSRSKSDPRKATAD